MKALLCSPPMRRSIVALFLGSSVLAPAVAANDAGLQVRELANGMKVIVKEDHRAPVAASMIWYRAGSMDEVNGTTGVAHVLEHMMFKGTRELPAGEFSRTIARAGGRDNAFTNKDYTAYHQQLQKSRLPLAMKLEADRMVNLILSAEEFAKEIKVVMEERRLRTDDQPRSLLYEEFLATAYQSHPYRTPVVGWMNDLEHLRADDARAWYGNWYAPNNATLVVVGDVQPDEVFAEAERHFGKIAPRALPVRKPQQEPAQTGVKRIQVKAKAELPYLMMGWHVPALREVAKDWEPYALWVLSAVLDGHDAARLNRDLVRGSQVAISAGTGYDPINRGPAVFSIDATPAPGHTVQEVEGALRQQIRRVVEQGVTAEELQRVKAQIISSEVYQRDSMFYQAMQIGMLDNAGLPADSSSLIARRLQEITDEQVRRVAAKYLIDDNLTVAVLDPQPLAAGEKPRPPATPLPH